MSESQPHERRFQGGADRLRAPERIALLEVPRVVGLCLEGLAAKSVLDVGTGSGVFAEAFAGLGLDVAGIDPNAEMLAAARTFVPAGRFGVGTAEAIPYPDRSFDLVFLGHVLHETDEPLEALEEARRVARSRVAVLEWPYRAEEQGPPLAHRLRPETILNLAARAGFAKPARIPLAHMDLYRLTF